MPRISPKFLSLVFRFRLPTFTELIFIFTDSANSGLAFHKSLTVNYKRPNPWLAFSLALWFIDRLIMFFLFKIVQIQLIIWSLIKMKYFLFRIRDKFTMYIMAINYWKNFKEKKQCIQPQEEGMPLNHECISQESSSTSTSTYGTLQYSPTGGLGSGLPDHFVKMWAFSEKRWTFWSTSIAAAEHLAEEGKYWVQNHPLDCLLQPTNNEEATMNL
jgi:hypothetical protein